jgi:hypothetical protein
MGNAMVDAWTHGLTRGRVETPRADANVGSSLNGKSMRASPSKKPRTSRPGSVVHAYAATVSARTAGPRFEPLMNDDDDWRRRQKYLYCGREVSFEELWNKLEIEGADLDLGPGARHLPPLSPEHQS